LVAKVLIVRARHLGSGSIVRECLDSSRKGIPMRPSDLGVAPVFGWISMTSELSAAPLVFLSFYQFAQMNNRETSPKPDVSAA
jgi:hypothetical protein